MFGLDKKHIIIVSVFLALIIIAIVFFSMSTKTKKNYDNQNNEVEDEKDVTNIVIDSQNIRQLKSYQNLTESQKIAFSNAVKVDFAKMEKTKSLWNDDEQTVYNMLATMSKAYIYQFKAYFKKTRHDGISLEEFLQSYLSTSEYQKALNIIDNAN